LRWYAEDRPAWPAPITTTSVLSATRGVGGRVEEDWVGIGVPVSSEGFFALIVMRILKRWSVRLSRFADKPRSRRADSNRLPLLQLRVCGHALQELAEGCKTRIPRRLSLLQVAASCTVLRSRWYQSGVNIILVYAFDGGLSRAGSTPFPARQPTYQAPCQPQPLPSPSGASLASCKTPRKRPETVPLRVVFLGRSLKVVRIVI
jgi:hypothetical protein